MRALVPARSAPVMRVQLAAVVAVATVLAGTAGAVAADPDDLSLAPAQPRLTGRVTGDKSPSAALARTPARLRTSTSTARIPVMIKYDYDPLASYTGTVPGLEATSPSVTGDGLRPDRGRDARYLDFVRGQERRITSAVTRAVPSARVTGSFRIVYGGVSAVVTADTVRRILQVPGVVAVQEDARNQPLTDSSTEFIDADWAYRALGSRRNAGQGVLLGNLDTGLWPEHESFADRPYLPEYAGPGLPCDFGDNPLTPAEDPFECNDKLVGGAAFLDTYNLLVGEDYLYPGTARDPDGHGSHTSGTSAGNVVRDVDTVGPVLDRINGVAPGARVIEYRVCAPEGCFTSDSVAAVEQAVLDWVDVINFSISGGNDPLTDPVELSFLDAYNAGVFVAASAGNSGPGAGTANHLGPWTTTVAASTQRREFATTLSLSAAGGATFTVDGASITAGAGPLPVVLASAAPYSDERCLSEAPAGLFEGTIVVCRRGTNARVEKGYNVLQGGAEGMVLYNPALADIETDNHWLPTVHVADGTDLLEFLTDHSAVTGEFAAGEQRQGQGDVMAAFSSRGPAGSFIKPDITAPGVQILAAMTPTPESSAGGPPGEYYQAIAGTSMSSPHIAGVALLLTALHPRWTPGQIKSAVMTQAVREVVKEDLVTPADAFDMGAGRVDVRRASAAPLTISETAANFAAMTGDPLQAIHLNIPSINAPTMPGRVTTSRTVTNVTRGGLWVTPGAAVPEGTRIQFSPAKAWVPRGASRRFEITIRSWAAQDVQRFARVDFRTRAGTARIPVAFVRRQGEVSLTQDCAREALERGEATRCAVSATNESFEEQRVRLVTSTNRRLRLVDADGATLDHGVVRASATLAAAEPGVPAVDPGASPVGYLDLEDFGVVPEPIGDEELLNVSVPAFSYNGRSYTEIGVDSNGYLVVGGGTSADNNCCNLPAGPSPAPPNDLLAPFWTDLDGTEAEGIRMSVLVDDVNEWLVVQWDVNVFGTADARAFQVWIGLNGEQDISFTYAAAQADPNGQDHLVGAENQAGEGDVVALLPSEDLVVTSSDAVPGGSLDYSVRVRAVRAGRGIVHTEMTADGVLGVTTVNSRIRVTEP